MAASTPYIVAVLLAFGISLGLVHLMLASGLGLTADIPNERSMHDRIVPRGGGLCFVASTLLVAVALRWVVLPSGPWVWYVLPLLAMAVLGWLEDRSGLGILTRFMFQALFAVLLAMFLLEGDDAGPIFGSVYIVWFAVIVMGTIWVTNLYNFMDGMDGLAAGNAVVVLATLALWFVEVEESGLAVFCLVLAGSVAGFLVVNWHPARVFMGDSGSLALGMVIAALSFGGMFKHDLPVTAFVILMGVFLFDATFTLLRRIIRGEKWWQSHRSHLYQRAAGIGFSQVRIVTIVIVLDILLATVATMLVGGLLNWGVAAAITAIVLVLPVMAISRRETRMMSGKVAG